MNHTEDFNFCFEFEQFMHFAISSSSNICSIKLGITEALFLCPLNHFHWDVLPLAFHNFQFCYVGLLIKLEKAWSTKSSYDSNFICSYLHHPGLLVQAMVLIQWQTIVFNLWMEKTKASHDEQFFLKKIKVYLAHNIKGFYLLFNSALFLLKSSI